MNKKLQFLGLMFLNQTTKNYKANNRSYSYFFAYSFSKFNKKQVILIFREEDRKISII